jgi:hypothetical protein
MATREEATEYLRSIPRMTEGDDGLFIYHVDLAEDGRSQLVLLRVLDDFIVLSSPFAAKDDITAREAVDLAMVFGVTDMDDHYGLRHVIFIEDLDESEIVNGISLLGVRADALERKASGNATWAERSGLA